MFLRTNQRETETEQKLEILVTDRKLQPNLAV